MRFTSCLTLILLAQLASPVLAQQAAPVDKVRKAATKWLDARTDSGLVIVENDVKTAFTIRPVAGRKSSMMIYQKSGWYLSLGFDGAITEKTPLKTVRKQLKYVALNRLPTPGLNAPGWEVKPQTPVSSFKKGVEILEYRDGKITLRVRTEFFALYGRNPNVLVPADAPSPPGTYFQIRRKFPLDLTLAASVK